MFFLFVFFVFCFFFVFFCCWDTFFSGGCYSILRLVICCERRKEFHRRCFCCVLFLLSMFVRFLFVFDLLFILFRIVLWPSVGKDCPSAFHCSNFKCRLGCACPSPVWCFWAGCRTRLYRLQIIAFLSTFHSQPKLRARRRRFKSGPAMGHRKRSPSAEGTRRREHERRVFSSRKGGSGDVPRENVRFRKAVDAFYCILSANFGL